MRVRISYGMEIEDIPGHVEKMGSDAYEDLKNTAERLLSAIDLISEADNDYSTVLDLLEKVRLKLTKSDLIITDLSTLLEGLHNYYNGEQNVSERRPTMDPSGNTNEQTEDTGKG